MELNPGARVRMDSLSKGDRFTPAYGGHFTYDRVDGALSGCHHVIGSDGKTAVFAACAEVELGWHEKGWLQRW